MPFCPPTLLRPAKSNLPETHLRSGQAGDSGVAVCDALEAATDRCHEIFVYSAQQHADVPLSDYLSEWAVCQAEGGRAPIAGRLLLRDRENRIVVLSPHALLSCASLLFPVTVYFAV